MSKNLLVEVYTTWLKKRINSTTKHFFLILNLNNIKILLNRQNVIKSKQTIQGRKKTIYFYSYTTF